jgi:hypothetical protein
MNSKKLSAPAMQSALLALALSLSVFIALSLFANDSRSTRSQRRPRNRRRDRPLLRRLHRHRRSRRPRLRRQDQGPHRLRIHVCPQARSGSRHQLRRQSPLHRPSRPRQARPLLRSLRRRPHRQRLRRSRHHLQSAIHSRPPQEALAISNRVPHGQAGAPRAAGCPIVAAPFAARVGILIKQRSVLPFSWPLGGGARPQLVL